MRVLHATMMKRFEIAELVENLNASNSQVNFFLVLEFFNSRMDAQVMDGGWSVNEVLQVVIVNCRSWRVDGMKMFTQLHFTYEQESHPEEFFIPYVWKLVLSKCEFEFNATAINLFPADIPTKKLDNEVEGNTFQNSDFDEV